MSEHKSSALKPLTLVGLALALGVIAGIVAVYVKGAASVHVPDVAAISELSAKDTACQISDVNKAALDAAATGDVAAMLPAGQPRNLSSLAFVGPDDKPISMGAFKGRTVLMNLWATWCVPCREEMPALDALQAKAGGSSFEVVAINVDADAPEKRKAFLTETKIDALKDYSEPTISLFNDLKRQGLALGLPVTLLIGPNGCLLSAMNGPANWSGNDAVKFIAAAQGLTFDEF
ncbi:MAG: thiol:disulfide interchange protein TlpA [Rhizobiaceae bacterium]